LLEPSEFSPAQRSLYGGAFSGLLDWADKAGFRTRSANGGLLGPFNAFLYSAEIADAMLAYNLVETRLTTVSPQLREVVILTVGAVWKSDYELYAHGAVAQSVGIDAEDIALVCSGEPPVNLGPEGAVAQRFALAIMKSHQVSDDLYAEALAQFGHKALIDMIHLAGIYTTICALLNTFRVPAE
jgi:4-carboxymuconolactone decarboxylase